MPSERPWPRSGEKQVGAGPPSGTALSTGVALPTAVGPGAYTGGVTPVPSPGPITVMVQSGPVDWWVVLAGLGPLAVLVAALLAFYINWRTLKQRTAADRTALEQKREADAQALRQKTEADSRAEWWRRTQWALDRALDDDQGTKALGLATLDVLARSELAREEELELFDIAWKNVAGEENGEADGGTPEIPRVDVADNMGENGTTDIGRT